MSRRRPLLSAFVAGTLVLAACGGSDEQSSDTTSGTAAGSTPATEPNDTEPNDTEPNDTEPNDGTTAPGTAAPVSDAPGDETADRESLPPIFQLAGPSIDGDQIDLAEYADLPLLLWFWAPF